MKKFWKKQKSQEEVLKEMRTEEQIRLMNAIKQNAADGKPESDNLIMLKEMNYHSSMDAEDAKKETERSNRRSKVEKVAGTLSPFVIMGCAVWNAKRDADGENINRSQGGKTISKIVDGAAAKINDFKNSFKK
jgi:hypothetical protein